MIKQKIKDNKHFGILTYYLIIFLLYYYTEQTVEPRYFLSSKLDNYIPFVEEMVIPYIMWYFYIAISLLYLGLKSKDDFYKLCTFMFIGMTVCFFVYVKLPNGHNLRPEMVESDVFSKLISIIYKIDTPTNSAPSIHVLISIAIHMSLTQYKGLKNRIAIKISSAITMILIIISTVMIKQHSILDGVYSLGLSIILYFVVYKIDILHYFNINNWVFITENDEID